MTPSADPGVTEMTATMPTRTIRAPASHPYLVTLSIDPADWRRVERMIDDRPELRLLDLDDRHAERWTVTIGCASDRVRDTVEDGWG